MPLNLPPGAAWDSNTGPTSAPSVIPPAMPGLNLPSGAAWDPAAAPGVAATPADDAKQIEARIHAPESNDLLDYNQAAKIYGAEKAKSLGQKIGENVKGTAGALGGYAKTLGKALWETTPLNPKFIENVPNVPVTLAHAALEETAQEAEWGRQLSRKVFDTVRDIGADDATKIEHFRQRYNDALISERALARGNDKSGSVTPLPDWAGKPLEHTTEALKPLVGPLGIASMGAGGGLMGAGGRAVGRAVEAVPGGAAALRVAQAAKAVPGKLLEKVPGAVAATGRALQSVAGLPEKGVSALAEKAGLESAKDAIHGAAETLGWGGFGLGLVGHGGALGKAALAIKGTQSVGKLAEMVGEFGRRLTETGGDMARTRLLQIATDASTPKWMQDIARVMDGYGVGAAGEIAGKTAASAAHGYAHGQVLGQLGGENQEQAGQFAGFGAGLGAAGRLAGFATGREQHGKQLQIAIGARMRAYEYATTPKDKGGMGLTPGMATQIKEFPALVMGYARELLGDKINFEFHDPAQIAAAGGHAGAKAWYDPTSKTIHLPFGDVSNRELHEIMHPLAQALGADGEARQLINSIFTPEQIGAMGREYAGALAGSKDPATVDAKVAELNQTHKGDGWLYDEIYADAGFGAMRFRMAQRGKRAYSFVPDILGNGRTVWDRLADRARGESLNFFGNLFNKDGKPSVPKEALFSNPEVYFNPQLRQLVYEHLRRLARYGERAGNPTGGDEGMPIGVKQTALGKTPAAPKPVFLENGMFVEDTKTGTLRPSPRLEKQRDKAKTRELLETVVNQPVKPKDDKTPEVGPRVNEDGKLEVSGTKLASKLGPAFGAWAKKVAGAVEQIIGSGKTLKSWYYPVYDGGKLARGGDLPAKEIEYAPFLFRVDKKGHALITSLSVSAAERKMLRWQMAGKLEPFWAGDLSQFRTDLMTYLKNHAEGKPGAEGIGEKKRDVLNTFVVGKMATVANFNPLRPDLRGEDRAGIIRDLRLDRVATVDPGTHEGWNAEYQRKKYNFSPDEARPQNGWTRETAEQFLNEHERVLGEAGFAPQLVGSVLNKGRSGKDLDVVLRPSKSTSMEQSIGDFVKQVLPKLDTDAKDVNPFELGTHPGVWVLNVLLRDGRVIEFMLDERDAPIEGNKQFSPLPKGYEFNPELDNGNIAVVDNTGEHAGAIWWKPTGKKTVHIEHLDVGKEHRGQGIGEALLRELVRRLPEVQPEAQFVSGNATSQGINRLLGKVLGREFTGADVQGLPKNSPADWMHTKNRVPVRYKLPPAAEAKQFSPEAGLINSGRGPGWQAPPAEERKETPTGAEFVKNGQGEFRKLVTQAIVNSTVGKDVAATQPPPTGLEIDTATGLPTRYVKPNAANMATMKDTITASPVSAKLRDVAAMLIAEKEDVSERGFRSLDQKREMAKDASQYDFRDVAQRVMQLMTASPEEIANDKAAAAKGYMWPSDPATWAAVDALRKELPVMRQNTPLGNFFLGRTAATKRFKHLKGGNAQERDASEGSVIKDNFTKFVYKIMRPAFHLAGVRAVTDAAGTPGNLLRAEQSMSLLDTITKMDRQSRLPGGLPIEPLGLLMDADGEARLVFKMPTMKRMADVDEYRAFAQEHGWEPSASAVDWNGIPLNPYSGANQPVAKDAHGNSYAAMDVRAWGDKFVNFMVGPDGKTYAVDVMFRPIDHADIDANEELGKYAPKNSEKILYSPDPKQIVVGNVNEDGEVRSRAVPRAEADDNLHEKFGLADGIRWRLAKGKLFWWEEPDNEFQVEQVIDKLRREGHKVERQVVMGDYDWTSKKFNQLERQMHGARPEQFSGTPHGQGEMEGMQPDEPKAAILKTRKGLAVLAKQYPEAIRPRLVPGTARVQKVGYDLTGAPLVKREGVAKAVDTVAGRMVRELEAYTARPDIMAAKDWYAGIRETLRHAFGANADVLGELLAATSARTGVADNFKIAVEAMRLYSQGSYDDLLSRYTQFVEQNGGSDKGWKEMPLKENGQKYNANSRQVLRVLAARWAEKAGLKTAQFADNLTGADNGATIDVWAARTLRRLVYSKEGERWRILPVSEKAVAPQDFKFAQAVMAHAAERMGVAPEVVQSLMWFGEKDLWEKNGWTRGTGARKSSFTEEMSKLSGENLPGELGLDLSAQALTRVQAGVTDFTSEENFKPAEHTKWLAGVRKKIGSLPGLLSARVHDTKAIYGGPEPSADIEATLSDAKAVNELERYIYKLGRDAGQSDTMFSRVVKPDHPNARPGLVAVFKRPLPEAKLDTFLEMVEKAGLGGMTPSRDSRGRVTGFRTQFVPEFSARFDPENMANHLDPAQFEKNAKDWRERAEKLLDGLAERGVRSARLEHYDTRVYGKEESSYPEETGLAARSIQTEFKRRLGVLGGRQNGDVHAGQTP